MEIFNIGLGEMIVIGIIALLVFGPERLPELARQAARFLSQMRGAADEIQRALLAESEPIKQSLNEVKQEVAASAAPIKESQQLLSQTVEEAHDHDA